MQPAPDTKNAKAKAERKVPQRSKSQFFKTWGRSSSKTNLAAAALLSPRASSAPSTIPAPAPNFRLSVRLSKSNNLNDGSSPRPALTQRASQAQLEGLFNSRQKHPEVYGTSKPTLPVVAPTEFLGIIYFESTIRVTGMDAILSPERWYDRADVEMTHDFVDICLNIIFGAAAAASRQLWDRRVERQLTSENLFAEQLTKAEGGTWEMKINIRTVDLVSKSTLENSPDLGYNIPVLARVFGIEANNRRHLLASSRHYIDISVPGVKEFVLDVDRAFSFNSSDYSSIGYEVNTLRFDVIDVKAAEGEGK